MFVQWFPCHIIARTSDVPVLASSLTYDIEIETDRGPVPRTGIAPVNPRPPAPLLVEPAAIGARGKVAYYADIARPRYELYLREFPSLIDCSEVSP